MVVGQCNTILFFLWLTEHSESPPPVDNHLECNQSPGRFLENEVHYQSMY